MSTKKKIFSIGIDLNARNIEKNKFRLSSFTGVRYNILVGKGGIKMEAKIEIMTLGKLKEKIAEFEKNNLVSDETKIFLDTGWDSIQEIAPDALGVDKAQQFVVEDELTHERFSGYTLEKNAEKMNAKKETETVIVLRNLY